MTEVGRIKTGTHTARMRSIARRKASGVGKDEVSPIIVLSCCESVVLLRWWIDVLELRKRMRYWESSRGENMD
jgi:hypothetical protein